MARKIAGIEGVLGDLVSGTKAVTPTASRVIDEKPKPNRADTPGEEEKIAEPSKSEPPQRSKKPVASLEHEDEQPPRNLARLGRPPGVKRDKKELKEKTSIWISASLMADYREWSWEARCNLGELIERALREFRERHVDGEADQQGSEQHPASKSPRTALEMADDR